MADSVDGKQLIKDVVNEQIKGAAEAAEIATPLMVEKGFADKANQKA